MKKAKTGHIIFSSLRLLVVSLLRLVCISIAFVLKLLGTVLSQVGNTIENIIVKRST